MSSSLPYLSSNLRQPNTTQPNTSLFSQRGRSTNYPTAPMADIADMENIGTISTTTSTTPSSKKGVPKFPPTIKGAFTENLELSKLTDQLKRSSLVEKATMEGREAIKVRAEEAASRLQMNRKRDTTNTNTLPPIKKPKINSGGKGKTRKSRRTRKSKKNKRRSTRRHRK